MILQALVRSYEALAAEEKLDRPGWLEVKVSWSLELDADGHLCEIIPLGTPDKKGKLIPRPMILPEMVKRSSGVSSNFLCDNATYMLGIDIKGDKKRAVDCFITCAAKHTTLLENVNHPFAQAICRFFNGWDAQNAESNPLILPMLDSLKNGGNLVFSMNEVFAQEVPEIKDVWDNAYGDHKDTLHGRCLVTGKEGPIAILHPSIKGVVGAQATGASLVSFNGPSYESYGRMDAQGLNAPVSEYAAFAYGAALNYMLRKDEFHSRLGSTTTVYWAEGAQEEYSSTISFLFGENRSTVDQELLRNAVEDLRCGRSCVLNGIPLQPENRFYILGLAPNASRLSVRFFLENSFRSFAENMHKHQERLNIVSSSGDGRQELSVWALLNETANPNSKDKKPPDDLVGDVVRSILMDTPYPASLFAQIEVRLHSEHDITRGKAAIIKAYLIKNVVREQETHPMKEVLTVKLNDESIYAPYVLGRLFAVLEKLQEAANGSTTIRARYFNSACATPALVFPALIKLAQSHLNKLDGGFGVYYDKLLTSLCGRLEETLPKRLTLEEQGVFQLGYYHQKQELYTKKEDKNNG